MQISDFLFPKNKVAYIHSTDHLQTALEILEKTQYTAIPVIDGDGKYVFTLSEGDLLWKMKYTEGLGFHNLDNVKVNQIKCRTRNECVAIEADFEDMLELAADQNFVPVIDENQVFIGIIRRKDIIEYYTSTITD